MYKNNERLRGGREKVTLTQEQMNEYMKCAGDFAYWAQRYAKIVTLEDGIQLITFFAYQLRMIKTISSLKKKKKRGMVVLAPRQCGKTTAIYLYLLWYILFHPEKKVAIIANKAKNAKKILKSIKKTYELLPLWMQAGITESGWNESSIELANGSMIDTGSATSDNIRGGSFNIVYIDEYAFLPRFVADDFMKSVLPTILSGKSSQIFATSTPKGMNQFHRMWKGAVSGDTLFEPCRVHYQEVPAYRRPGFREEIIKTESLLTWKQEFECSFIGSSKTLVSSDVLENYTSKDPIREQLDEKMAIWEEPRKNIQYIMGVDVGKGVGGDYSVVQVCKIVNARKIVQVARFRCNMISVGDFAQVCISISKFYNRCEMMVENNEYGHIVAEKIWNVYEYDLIVNFEKDILGVRATAKSKALANTTLREYVENGYLTIHDDTTWAELSVYEEVRDNYFSAISGEHDDTVLAMLWVMYYLKASDEYADETISADKIINPRFNIYKNGEIPSANTLEPGEFVDDDYYETEMDFMNGFDSGKSGNLSDEDADLDWLSDV